MIPNAEFLGRTEIAVSTIHEQTRNRKTPWTKTFPLLEIESGEITIKIHLQIFEKHHQWAGTQESRSLI